MGRGAPIDWPLSREEKKWHLERLNSDALWVADGIESKALEQIPQPLSPRIAAILNAAGVALDLGASPVRPPPGLEEHPGLQEPQRTPPTRYQTPPPMERPASMLASPLDQYTSLFQSPHVHIASPCSPQALHAVSPPAWTPSSPTRRAGIRAPTSPAPRAGSSPAIFSTVPVAPAPPTAPLPPLQPPTWPASPAAQAPAWGVGPAPLAFSQLGTSAPPPPPTWGPGLSPWAGVPSCPPPSWPAPISLEVSSPGTLWLNEDTLEASPGRWQKPLKVYMEHTDCEALAIDPCTPAKKHVPNWF